MTRGLVFLMAVACGVTVANLYYSQPLLADIGRTFGVDADRTGLIQMLTQFGYAAGIFFFAPLGDIREKKRLILQLSIAAGLALAATAAAPGLWWMYIASFAVGVTSVGTQLIVPLAAQLAPPGESGKTVGSVMSGLLIGIMLSRIVAGFVGDLFGWRSMFWIAAALMIVMGIVLQRLLPKGIPDVHISYGAVLRSLGSLFVTQRGLREAALVGACLFGSLSVFWTALPFFLEGPHFELGSSVAGLFGLVGAAGAAAAPVIGRLTDRMNPWYIVGFMLGWAMLAYLTLGTIGYWMLGLVIGAILLDFGIQGGQVTNQTRIYSMVPEARSRLNTVLMVSTFIGGSIGASLGGYAWSWWGWTGTCTVGGGLILLSFLIWAAHRPKMNEK